MNRYAAGPAPWYRSLGLPVLAAVAAAVAGYAFGAPWPRAIGVGVVSGAVLFLFLRGVDLQPTAWPDREPVIDTPRARGGRWKVDALDRVRDYPDAFGHRLQGRLRAIVESVLAGRGVAWSDPAASVQLGADLHGLLDPDAPAAPDRAALSTAIQRITAVAVDPSTGRPLAVPEALRPRPGRR